MLLSLLAFLRTLGRLVAAVWHELRNPDNPEFRHLLMLVALTLGAGTVFYHTVEGWRWLDALYFSLVTLATVGFGDLSPKTDFGKIFTMVYILVGLGLLAGFVNVLGQHLLRAPGRSGRRRRPPAESTEVTDDDH